jgi:uncharacterized protein YndB with AHSA1/START domain
VRTIRVSVDINAPPARVWDYIKDVTTHPRWMKDAVAVRVTSGRREGVGTTFDCDTRVGPLRLTDRMEVTEWRAGETMAIRHVGLVTGEGRFDLHAIPTGTQFVWTESLGFPRRKGGQVAAAAAAPVLRRVWRGNLERLRQQVEGAISPAP